MAYYKKRNYKKSYKKPYKRNYFPKYTKKANNKIMNVQKNLAGFASSTFVKLKFTRLNVALGSGTTVDSTRWYLNDPTQNNTVAPQGWNTYKAVYDKFVVHGSKIKATFTNTSSTIPMRVSVTPIQDDSTSTNLNSQAVISQLPRSRIKYLSVQTGGKDVMSVSNYAKVKHLGGMKRLGPENEYYCGYTGSANSVISFTQPPELWSWNVQAQSTNGSNFSSTTYVDLEITFYIQFFEKLDGNY